MAKKERFYPAKAEHDRYMAMLKLNETKRKRTLGHLFGLRRQLLSDLAVAEARNSEVLDRVYRGETGPPETGQWQSYPKHRTMFCTPPWGGGRILATEYGWSSGYLRGWSRSLHETFYRSTEDADFLRRLLGRVPSTDLDKLVAAGEVDGLLQDNDPELALEAVMTRHRCNQVWQRVAVVKREIVHSVLKLLADREDWSPQPGDPWRRVSFEDGTVLTITDRGDVIFGDSMREVSMSLTDPASKSHNPSFSNSLYERQRKARERGQ